MDDVDDRGGGDDSKRKTRNASEKKRRDHFNILVTELGSMVSPANCSRKMDKTTVLKMTIAFLKQHNETSVRSHAHEIQEDWKPSFLSNDEFTHLMLEALEAFILVLDTHGAIIFASESITSLLGYIPAEMCNISIYDLVAETDKPALYNALVGAGTLGSDEMLDDKEVDLLLHLRRGGHSLSITRPFVGESGGQEDYDGCEDHKYAFELVKLTGSFRKWSVPEDGVLFQQREGGGGLDNVNSDDDNASVKSCFSRLSAGVSSERALGTSVEKTVLVSTVRLQTARLLREIPLVVHSTGCKSEFTSRYSLEWKFLFLDHRAPHIIGYLPFELLGTSGYDYYHFDDLERIAHCHEALMQTGEGTSCYHRFLSKGQQWIWLQARYYITYDQWNSKPEFVVATHKVVDYTNVLKALRRAAGHGTDNNDGGEGKEREDDERGDGSETLSLGGKSMRYPTTDSPTWSSKSSVFGGSSTVTSSRSISEKQQRLGGYSNDCSSSAQGGGDELLQSTSDFDNISQYISGGHHKRRKHHHHLSYHQQHLQNYSQQLQPSIQVGTNDGPSTQLTGDVNFVGKIPFAVAASGPPQPVLFTSTPTQEPPPGGGGCGDDGREGGTAVVTTAAVAAATNPSVAPRQELMMTPAQVQLQGQLRMKHSELTRRIAEQQEELRHISEQLLMSQYGLVPVNVTFPEAVSDTFGQQQQPSSVVAQNSFRQQQSYDRTEQSPSGSAAAGFAFAAEVDGRGSRNPVVILQPQPQILHTSIANILVPSQFTENNGIETDGGRGERQ